MNINNFPTISFVTPTYNAQRCLERCLKSIRSQDYPQEKIEIIIADGGSTDSTLKIVKDYRAKIYNNPRRLAEYGLAIAVQNSTGDFLVLAASDNELIGKDWLKKMLLPFLYDQEVSAEWGKMLSSRDDCPINHYYALIQNDPLTFFINKNLNSYVKKTKPIKDKGETYYIFNASADKPLPWGANCLIYKSKAVKHFWERVEYIGDNDIFQMMLETGSNRISYNPNLLIYHHTVGNLFDWMQKWKRNFKEHFLSKREVRNMNWAYVKNFKLKLLLWFLYSTLLPISFIHSVILAIKSKNIYWLYHPLASFFQAITYFYIAITSASGWKLIFDFFKGKKL